MQWSEFSFHIRHLNDADRKMIEKAFHMGEKAHEGQLRQSGEPYFTHPIAVALLLNEMHADGDTIAAALLHDTIEDTRLTIDTVEDAFGSEVAMLIEGVTKLSREDIAHHPTLDKQIETLRKMFTLMQTDIRIMVIKLADRLHNMQTIGFRTVDKQLSVAKETLDVYVKIADRLCMRDLRNTLEDLCYSILEPEMHAHILALRKKNESKTKMEIANLQKTIESSFPHVHIDIHYEAKSWKKLRLQYEVEGENPGSLGGMNIAVVCDTIDACYRTLGVFHQLWPRETLTFEDFINAPVVNGYKGLHTSVILEDGTRLRCKIRTTDMEKYAHDGVSLLCFDKEQKGLHDHLPWVEHITPLSDDTEERSDEFWQSLQTDILGESMILHGPSNQTVIIPKSATALDGALYLFGKKALHIKEIFVNNKQVAFYDELQNAVTLTAQFANTRQVDLSWLQYVRTGIASAAIRTGLLQASPSNKKQVGKRLLEQAIRLSGQVALEELAPSAIKQQLSVLRFSSMTQLYIAIAEGRLNADTVARNVFTRRRSGTGLSQWTLRIRNMADHNDPLEKVIRTYPYKKIKAVRNENGLSLILQFNLSPEQSQSLQMQLGAVSPRENWSMFETKKSSRILLSVIALIILWGLDPVIARLLLIKTVHPFDLTVIRFITFFIASSLTYILQNALGRHKLKPLSPFQPTLILSGFALFITGLFTYMSLTGMPATQYILFIVVGLMGTNLLSAMHHGKPWKLLALSVLGLSGGLSILLYLQGTDILAVLSAIMSSLGFALYSLLSSRYQKEEMTIQARYPAFMFWISCVCLLLSIVLLPVLDYSYPSVADLLKIVSFSLVFAVLPYVLFFETMRRTQSALLEHSLPLVVLSTILGEIILSFLI